MMIKMMMFTVMLLLSGAVFANPSQNKSPSELKWSGNDENCKGKLCVKVNDKPPTPNLLEKMDKFEQQNLKEPPAFRNNDRDQKSLRFIFGDDQ